MRQSSTTTKRTLRSGGGSKKNAGHGSSTKDVGTIESNGSVASPTLHSMPSDNGVISSDKESYSFEARPLSKLGSPSVGNSGTKLDSNESVPLSTTESTTYVLSKPRPVLAPLSQFAYPDQSSDLNSSPIKPTKPSKLNNVSSSPVKTSSSPTKRKKAVVFSDDLISTLSASSPNKTHIAMAKGDPQSLASPLKSILKFNILNEIPSNLNQSTTNPSENINSINNPSNPEFWLLGTIIQLPPGSLELPQLITGMMTVLSNPEFPRKFEVYAALNHMCKSNTSEKLFRLLTINTVNQLNESPSRKGVNAGSLAQNYVSTLSTYIQRDIIALETQLFEGGEDQSKIDPFCTRIISQALKLMAYLMADQELNNFISVEHARWFYLHASEMASKPTLSKTLVLSYLVIIKDCRFAGKRKRQIFDITNEISEKMLQCLLSMKGFSSSSLVVEKYLALKNLIANFPTMMAKNFDHWFVVLLVNLCDLNSPLYVKVINMGVQPLLEAARNFISNKNVLFSVRRLLATPLPQEIKSFSADLKISPSSQFDSLESQNISTFDFLVSNLEELIRNGQYKASMDIWVAITLLTSNSSSGYETWNYLSRWLKVHKFCFNQQDTNAKVTALISWKAIIYNVCHNDLDDLKRHSDETPTITTTKGKSDNPLNAILKPKVKLLLHPLLNVTAVESQKEIIDVLHSLFLSIIYTIFGTLGTKYMHIYWDKIIQPVLANFYFKKGLSNAYMNQLGTRVLNRLLKSVTAVNETNFNDMRCLSNDPITLNEINSINPKWVYSRFDRIMQNLVLVFKLEKLALEHKLNFLYNFFNCLKLSIKKEIGTTDSTYDIIDNVPFILDILFRHNKLTFEEVHKLIINLNDTFGPANLIGRTAGQDIAMSTPSVYYEILKNSMGDLLRQNLGELFALIYSAIGEKSNITFITDLLKLQKESPNDAIDEFLIQALNNKRISKTSKFELDLVSEFFQSITENFETITKKLIQDIVLGSPEEFERLLNLLQVAKWTLPVFKYFILLMHDAPHYHLKQMTLNLILLKWEDSEVFINLVDFLIENKFNFELFNLRKNIMRKFKGLDGFYQFQFRQSWQSYLTSVADSNNFVLLDEFLLASLDSSFDVKPYIRNRWDKLPILKKAWLTGNPELYIDKSIVPPPPPLPPVEVHVPALTIAPSPSPSGASVALDSDVTLDADITLDSLSPIKTLPPIENSTASLAAPATGTLTPSKAGKSKGRAKKGKSSTKSRKKPTKAETAATSHVGNFDIHSFTAMLTAKLSSPASKKEKDVVESVENNVPKEDSIQKEESIQLPEAGQDLIHDLPQVEDHTPTDTNSQINNDNNDNFDYEMYMRQDEDGPKSPEIEGTMEESLGSKRSASPDIGESQEKRFKLEGNSEENIELTQASVVEVSESGPKFQPETNAEEEEVISSLESDTHISPSTRAVGDNINQSSSQNYIMNDALPAALDIEDSNMQSSDESTELHTLQNGKEDIAANIGAVVQEVSDEQIESMTQQDRFDLETKLLGFMLRLRNSHPQ